MFMKILACPKCKGENIVKSGVIKERQRYLCKKCNYNYTVNKLGKKIHSYYTVKALQLYLEGLSFREIERIMGISHVTVSNWVKEYKVIKPNRTNYGPNYQLFSHSELVAFIKNKEKLNEVGIIITPLDDKFMLLKWEYLKK